MGTTDHSECDKERALLRRVRRGDVDAFEELYYAMKAPLYSYALRCVGNRADAEELVQETLMRLFVAARKGRLKTSPRAYAFSVAHNAGVDMARRRQRVIVLDRPAPPSASRSTERALLREEIDRALTHLPEHHRSALLLREFGGLSYAEIAETLEVSLGQVKIWIHRARKQLSDLVDRDGQYVGEKHHGA